MPFPIKRSTFITFTSVLILIYFNISANAILMNFDILQVEQFEIKPLGVSLMCTESYIFKN